MRKYPKLKFKSGSQNEVLASALLSGSRLTNLDIMKLVNTTTPSKRLSDVSKVIRVDRKWITTPGGKDVLQYFCKL